MPRTSATEREMAASGLLAQTMTEPDDMVFPAVIDTDEMREVYAKIYRANPSAHLYTDASEPILVQLVRHVVNANRISREIHRARDPKLLIQLSRAQRDESAAIASLSTKIRLSPSSVADSRGNLLPKKSSGPKPWEY